MEQSTKLDKATKISIATVVLIIVSIAIYYFVLYLPKSDQEGKKRLSQESNQNSEEGIKKKALEKISQELSNAIENNDIQKIYDNSEPSLINNIPRNKFITRYGKENDVASIKLQSSEEKINETNGEIKIAVFICETIESTLKWANKNQNNEIAKNFLLKIKGGEINSKDSEGCSDVGSYENMLFKYEYDNKIWKIVDIQPSERALVAASYYYIDYISESNQRKQDFFNRYSYGLDNKVYATKKYAIYLNNNLEQLVYLESVINKNKGINNQINSGSTANTPSASSNNIKPQTADPWDENEQRQKEQCQEDINKYTICMSKYNSEMAEYNSCLSEGKMSYCSKPFSFCYKPSCAY